MVESGVYGDFLRGVFEYQAHFQNLFKKIKLKLFKIKIEYFWKSEIFLVGLAFLTKSTF